MIKQETWMKVAEVIATESKAERFKVAAVLVNNDRIIATGINGMPRGYDNKCEDENGNTRPEVCHAEINAIAFAAKNGVVVNGSDVYCTLSPCVACASALSNAGIRNFYYRTAYRDLSGVHLLTNLGIKVEQI
jgi:dCMP deaminase